MRRVLTKLENYLFPPDTTEKEQQFYDAYKRNAEASYKLCKTLKKDIATIIVEPPNTAKS